MLKPSAWFYAHVFLEGHAVFMVTFVAGLADVLNFEVGPWDKWLFSISAVLRGDCGDVKPRKH